MRPDMPYVLEHNIDVPSQKDYYSHMHNEFEILYFIKGSAQYQIENTVYSLSPGDLLFIRPRIFHCLIPLEPKEYERFVLHFTAERIPVGLTETANTTADIHAYPVGGTLHRRFEQAFGFKNKIEEQDFILLMDGLLSEVLIRLKYQPLDSSSRSVKLDDTLAMILEEIDRNPQEVVDVQSLLKKYFVSRSWLEHSFRKQLGMTPLQYLGKKRILYAQSLIRGGLSPTLAAEHCRYGDYVTFYRNYKKILHVSPEEDKRNGAKG